MKPDFTQGADPYMMEIQAHVTDTALEFQENAFGVALERFGYDRATIEDQLRKMSSCLRFCSIDKLYELAKAENEKRIVALPCKIGDVVYRVMGRTDGSKYYTAAVVAGIHIVRDENRRYRSDRPHLVLKVDGGFCAHVDIARIGRDVFLEERAAIQYCNENGGMKNGQIDV